MRVAGIIVALAIAASARAAEAPSVCPPAPNTPAFDLGRYRGPFAVYAGGEPMFPDATWATCPVPGTLPIVARDDCAFSLCNMPDGSSYEIRFSDIPGPPVLRFAIAGGKLHLDTAPPTTVGLQSGNYGVDATGSLKPVAFDLRGYRGQWGLAHWPRRFTGTDTNGDGAVSGQVVTLPLYMHTLYDVELGGAHAHFSVDAGGALSLVASPGTPPVTLTNNVLTVTDRK